MQKNGELIWARALDHIKKEVDNDQTYQVWFAPIRCVSLDTGRITLEVANNFVKKWLLDRYMPVIRTGLERSSGKELAIEFVLGDGNAPDGMGDALAGAGPAQAGGGTRPFWSLPFSKTADGAAREIGLKPDYTFESFVEGSSNRFARAT